MAGDPRRTRAWRKLRDQVVQEEPLCWLRLPGCTRFSQTADHIIPFIQRPDLALVRANLHGACHHCNHARQDKPVTVATTTAPALDWFE